MHMSMSIITLSRTVGKFEHDRKCQPWWSFHQRERGETPGESDATVSGHKQQNWKVQTGLQLRLGWCSVTNNNHVTADYYLTLTWHGPPAPVPSQQMTCPTLLVVWEQDSTFGIKTFLDEIDPVLQLCSLTVQAVTFLSAVRAKAKHPSAICPSRMEHNSGIETSASNDNHTDT